MARSLMTPDELRRMDNDMCIIFEKGLKPIKANKYYYFKYPEAKIVERYKANHNDVQVQRSVWRKYNPMNPYEEGQDEDNNFPSLDSLFEDDESNVNISTETSNESIPKDGETLDTSTKSVQKIDNTPSKPKTTSDIDIQKELEAKFDELFGALDDDDNT
jgi:hypothetical protein